MAPLSFKQICKLFLMSLLSGVFFCVGIPFLNALALFWAPDYIYSNDAFLSFAIVAGQNWWLMLFMGGAYFLMTVHKNGEVPYNGRFPWIRNVFISLSLVYLCMVIQFILHHYYPGIPAFLYSGWIALLPMLIWQAVKIYKNWPEIYAQMIRSGQPGCLK